MVNTPLEFTCVENEKYYQNLNPFSFFIQAAVLDSFLHKEDLFKELPSFSFEGDGDSSIITKQINNSRHSLSLGIRLQRYLGSELLFLLLLSDLGDKSLVWAASKIRGPELADIFKCFAKGKVPTKHEKYINGVPLSLTEWISHAIFDSPNELNQSSDESIVSLIRQEAELLSSRGAINAIKHGKSLTSADQVGAMVISPNGEQLNHTFNGVSWVDTYISETKGLVSASVGFEEINPQADIDRISQTSLILDAIKQSRIHQIERKNEMKIRLPIDLKEVSVVKRTSSTIEWNIATES